MIKPPIIRTGLGQDSHRFLPEGNPKPCVLGGMVFEDMPGFEANSDGDVILHALCNAITSLTGVTILGIRADELLEKEGITDSQVYLKEALKTLGNQQITHVAISIEANRPKFLKKIPVLRETIAKIMELEPSQVGVTATTGEGLTDFGLEKGVQVFCIITSVEKNH